MASQDQLRPTRQRLLCIPGMSARNQCSVRSTLPRRFNGLPKSCGWLNTRVLRRMSWLNDFGLLRSLGWGARSKVVFGNPMTAYSTAYSIPNDLSISARIAHFSNFQTYSTAYSRVDFLAYEALQTHARPQRKACLMFCLLTRLPSTPYRRI